MCDLAISFFALHLELADESRHLFQTSRQHKYRLVWCGLAYKLPCMCYVHMYKQAMQMLKSSCKKLHTILQMWNQSISFFVLLTSFVPSLHSQIILHGIKKVKGSLIKVSCEVNQIRRSVRGFVECCNLFRKESQKSS